MSNNQRHALTSNNNIYRSLHCGEDVKALTWYYNKDEDEKKMKEQ